MKNYERYSLRPDVSPLENWISTILWRGPSDKVIVPVLNGIRNKKVCDVGCGTGAYSRIFLSNGNAVVGIDKNPGRCRENMPVHDDDAAHFSHRFKNAPCDVVFSGWLTEYLDPESLNCFFRESYDSLRPGGVFISTVISPRGWGRLYVTLARRCRKVEKYAYTPALVESSLRKTGFRDITVRSLPGAVGLSWAELVMAQK